MLFHANAYADGKLPHVSPIVGEAKGKISQDIGPTFHSSRLVNLERSPSNAFAG
jgi:hypothetical protein